MAAPVRGVLVAPSPTAAASTAGLVVTAGTHDELGAAAQAAVGALDTRGGGVSALGGFLELAAAALMATGLTKAVVVAAGLAAVGLAKAYKPDVVAAGLAAVGLTAPFERTLFGEGDLGVGEGVRILARCLCIGCEGWVSGWSSHLLRSRLTSPRKRS